VNLPEPKIRIEDVARAANVSVATVDRVLNRRGNVKRTTAQHVLNVLERLQYIPDENARRLAKQKVGSFCIAIPGGPFYFFRKLEKEFERLKVKFLREGVTVRFAALEDRDTKSVVHFLSTVAPSFDGVAIVSFDHPSVLEAVNGYCAKGGKVVCIVSDLPRSRRQSFVGIDNVSAGRTAAYLLGRFSRTHPGSVALLSGSRRQRDHQDRILGFQSVLHAEFPFLKIVSLEEEHRTDEGWREYTERLLKRYPDVRGIYNTGAENAGIARAIKESGSKGSIVFVAHELTDESRVLLADGVLDVVLNQDAHFIASRALRTLTDLWQKKVLPEHVMQLGVVEIYVRDNIPPKEE
jgi:LacI family transcriptional regulator, galactose operon repressor